MLNRTIDHIFISPKEQSLQLIRNGLVFKKYSVSTAKNGLGTRKNSFCTPIGWHIIRAKIGANAHPNTVFIGRRASGEIYSPSLALDFPNRDWILGRILWLSGLEPGKNRLAEVDSMQRFIYIHGCPEELKLGYPSSKGCIRMHPQDIVDLFELVDIGTKIYIDEQEYSSW